MGHGDEIILADAHLPGGSCNGMVMLEWPHLPITGTH